MSHENGFDVARIGASPVLGSDLFAARAPERAASVDEARDYLGRLLVPHRLTLHGQSGFLQLKHSVARIDRIGLHFIAYSTSADFVEVRAPKIDGNYFLKFPLSGSAEISQDGQSLRVSPGMMYVGQPCKPMVSVMSRDYRQLMLEIPEAFLLAALRRTPGGPGPEPLRFDIDAIHRNPAPRLLLSTLGAICEALEAGDGMIARPTVQRAFQDTLASLVLSLPHNHAEVADSSQAGAVPYYVRRAETYLRAHLTDEVGIDDLVRVAGVSRRSLHAGFRKFRATTPLGLFKSMRLEAARNALLRAGDDQITVTEVATTYGFYHLSKFARDFRETFGELPSDLLRKAGR